jgi:hypothetical protein
MKQLSILLMLVLYSAVVTAEDPTESPLPVTPGDTFDYTTPRDHRPKLDFDRTRVTLKAQPAAVPVHRPAERIDRGVVALPIDGGGVYIGWRLLADDGEAISFNVERSDSEDGLFTQINAEPIATSTNYTDKSTKPGQRLYYRIASRLPGMKETHSKVVTVETRQAGQSHVAIQLPRGAHDAGRVGIADLDGDGAYDFVVKSPSSRVDPFVWSKSTTTIKLHAIRSDGKHLWTHDMGWNIENGIWFSPYVVADCDADGKADVFVKYCP